MDTEMIWMRLVAAAAEPAVIASDGARRALLTEAMTVGTTITADSVGCSITESLESGFRTPVASSSLAMDLDTAQYRDDDGPCVAACRDGEVHSITVMGDEHAYPGFTQAALRHEVRSSLSLPLPALQRASALNLYARSPSAFDSPHARAVAMLLARCTAAILTTDPFAKRRLGPSPDAPPAATGRREPEPGPELDGDALLIGRASAILGDREGLDVPQAVAELIRRSRTARLSIFDVARSLVSSEPDTGAQE